MADKEKLSQKEYEKLGKLLVSIGESGVANRDRLYRTAFVKGIYSGVGGVIGATVVIALLVWFLSFFEDFLIIGPIVEAVKRSLEMHP